VEMIFQHCYHVEVASSLPNAVVFSPARGLLAPVEALADRFSAAWHRSPLGGQFSCSGPFDLRLLVLINQGLGETEVCVTHVSRSLPCFLEHYSFGGP